MSSDQPAPAATERTDAADREALGARIAALEAENAVLRHCNARPGASQERLRRIVESARDHAIIALDLEGCITGWSRGAENVLGWAENEVLGRDGSLIFTPEDRAVGAPAEEQRVAREQGVAEDERWHVRKDGSRLWLSGSLVLLRDGAGVLEGYLKVARDETKRRRAEEALRESELLKHAILGTALDCIVTIDHESRIVEWNPAAERTFGHARQAALGQDIAELIIPPEYREAHRRGLTHYLATGEGPVLGRRIEVEALRADGTTFPAELAIAPSAMDGKTLFTAYLRDISERRQAEAALRESEAHFRAIADNIAQMAWMARPDSSRYWYNRRWYEYTGMSPEQAEGLGWRQLHHSDHLGRVLAGMRRAWEAGEPWEDIFPLRGKNGEFRWFLTRAVPVRDAEGRVALWFGTNTDITAQREAEEALAKSEARFRAAVEAVNGILWTNNAAGEMTGEQPGWAALTGQTFDEYQGFGWAKAVHPEDAQGTIDAWSRAVAEHRLFVFEHRLRRHDGVWRHFAIRAIPVSDAGGAIREWVGVHTDITEQRDTEEALHEESRTLEVLNQTGAILAAELDLGTIVQKVTDAATELSGAAFGAFFYNVVSEKEENYTLYALSGAPREAFVKFPLPRNTGVFGPTFRGEGIIRSDDITRDARYGRNTPHRGMPEGHLPVRSYLAVPVVSRSGEVLGGLFFGHPEPAVFTTRAEHVVAGIASQAAIAIDNARLYQASQREIAARKAAEEDLRRLNETLERLVEERTAALLREVEERRRAEEALRQGEKLAAIGQLTGGIAHDFNNILQVVSSGATLLRRTSLSEERRVAILDGLAKAAQNAKELTGRLLAFARKQALQPVALDLKVRLKDMAELLRQSLGSHLRVETDFVHDLWPVMADPSQLEVAVLNLAANARDAMLPEGGTLTLQTRNARLEATSERASGEYVCLTIKDTGKGMQPAVLARAFEPFFTTKGPDKGTGLGLAQVHGFAKQSGGDVAIESAPGHGTTITFHLPRASMATKMDAPPVRVAGPAGAALERTAGKTVLVVEDNPDVASFTVTMLEGLGYATRRAANAADALSLLESGEPVDALFSDIVMPGPINGVQLATILRLRHPRLAVLLATGYSEILTEWQRSAVAEVLGKPYRLDELAAALERAFATAEEARAET